jgi:hypothetical protein
MSAAGTIAPLYLTVTGLTERELSVDLCPTGVLILKVEGFKLSVDSLTAVAWQDGACPQLAAIVNEAQQTFDAHEKVISCKHTAAGTGTQQPCDLCAGFRTLKQLQRITTADYPTAKSLRDRVVDTLKSQPASSQPQDDQVEFTRRFCWLLPWVDVAVVSISCHTGRLC